MEYYHHNWMMREGSEFTDYPKYFEDNKDVVTQKIWGRNYDELHPLSKAQIQQQVAIRYNKEVLK